MVVVLTIALFLQCITALTPYPLILDESGSDNLYDVSWDNAGHYLLWSINGTDTLTIKYARANESFAIPHSIGVFPKSVYNGGFKWAQEPSGGEWVIFSNGDFTGYHSCNLTAGPTLYNVTPIAKRNEGVYMVYVDETKGRVMYLWSEGQTGLTGVYTADYDGQRATQILSIKTDVLMSAWKPPNVSAELSMILTFDPYTQVYMTSMDPNASIVQLGLAQSGFNFQPIGALMINNIATICGQEFFNGIMEVACYEMNAAAKRTSICKGPQGRYIYFFLFQHFAVGSWDAGFPSMEGGVWEIYKCDVLSTVSTDATLAAKGDGQFTTVTFPPFSANLRGTTTLFSVAVNGSAPDKPQGNAVLIQYDADPSKPQGGIVDVAEYHLAGSNFAYGNILSENGVVNETFAWAVNTQNLGFHLRIFDSTTGKANVLMNDQGVNQLLLGYIFYTPQGELIWSYLHNGGRPTSIYKSSLTVPSNTQLLATINSSQYFSYLNVVSDNHLLLSGFSTSSPAVPAITVPHPRLKKQQPSRLEPFAAEVLSLDLNNRKVSTLQHLQDEYSISLRYVNSSGLYVWNTGGVVYSAQAPFESPDDVISRLSVVSVKAFTADFVPGCVSFFADKSPDPWNVKKGWAVGFAGLGSERQTNATCKPQY